MTPNPIPGLIAAALALSALPAQAMKKELHRLRATAR